MTNLPISLYSRQFTFIQDERSFLAFIAGIGAGKSIAGAARAISAGLGTIGTRSIATPNIGMVTAPSYNVLRDATVPAFREMAGDLIAEMTASSPINATLINGSRIFFRSAHKQELLRGPSVAWWWGDEAALYHRDVWRIMIGRLRQHGKLGHAWLTTTPKGRNWIYQEFVQQQRQQYAIYKAATWMNPFIDPEYYRMLRESYTGDFARQELEGDFVAFEGLIYSEFDRETHMLTVKRPEQYAMVVAGVDWGYANPGVIVVYGVDTDGRMWGLHEEYQRRRRIEEWAQVAQQLQQQHGIETFFCDPSEPDFIAQFQQAFCNAVAANNEVLTGIQAVKNRLVRQKDGLPRLILSPDFVWTAAEFEQYQWMEHRDGLRDQPKKAGDHAMDATRYVVMGVDAGFGGSAGEMYLADQESISTGSDY